MMPTIDATASPRHALIIIAIQRRRRACRLCGFGTYRNVEQQDGWWIYWLSPMIGALAAILVCSSLARRIEVAKLYHFESDRRRLFFRMAGGREEAVSQP